VVLVAVSVADVGSPPETGKDQTAAPSRTSPLVVGSPPGSDTATSRVMASGSAAPSSASSSGVRASGRPSSTAVSWSSPNCSGLPVSSTAAEKSYSVRASPSRTDSCTSRNTPSAPPTSASTDGRSSGDAKLRRAASATPPSADSGSSTVQPAATRS
jgi:hypothetical protein